MSETMPDGTYIIAILKALSTLHIGQPAGDMNEIVRLGGTTLAEADYDTLLNIVGGQDGLYDQGLVRCGKVLPGNPSTQVADIRDVTITPAGRAYLKNHEA